MSTLEWFLLGGTMASFTASLFLYNELMRALDAIKQLKSTMSILQDKELIDAHLEAHKRLSS